MSKNKKKRKVTKKGKFPTELIDAARAAHLTYEQIAAYDTEESLRAVVNRFKPMILASAGTPSPSKPPREPVEMVDVTKTLTIKLSPMRGKTVRRGDDEQVAIDAFVNRNGLRRTMFRQELDRSFEPGEKNKYITTVVIHYRVPKGD